MIRTKEEADFFLLELDSQNKSEQVEARVLNGIQQIEEINNRITGTREFRNIKQKGVITF